MVTTKYNISINKDLIWDYSFEEKEYNTDYFFKWYLARVLNNGTAKDIATIPFEIIKEHLKHLNLSSNVRKFWDWYFKLEE